MLELGPKELALTSDQVAYLVLALQNELRNPATEGEYQKTLKGIFRELTGKTFERYLEETEDSRFTLVPAALGEASGPHGNQRLMSEVRAFAVQGEYQELYRAIFPPRGDTEMVLFIPGQRRGALTWGGDLLWTECTSAKEIVRRHLDQEMV